MDFRTFQDGMFPKWRRLFLCRAQILPSGSHFPVDLKERVWYDNGVGSDFFRLLFCSLNRSRCPRPRRIPGHEMTPDIRRGSFLFLGFNHWVTSLSAGSTGLWYLVGIPSAAFMFLSLLFAFGIYVKRKILKAQPAGVLTISGITFFRTTSLPHFHVPCNTGFRTNNFRINDGKGRKRNFWPGDNWQEKAAVV